MTRENDYFFLYPEVQEAGDLAGAIMAGDDFLPGLTAQRHARGHAAFSSGRRQLSVSCALETRLFIVQFWQSGVVYARAGLADLNPLRLMARAWLKDTVGLQALKSLHPNAELLARGLAFEAGLAVDYEWTEYLKIGDANFATLMEAASKQPLLRQLFPIRSMNTLRFSRVAGYPATTDLPYFEVVGDQRYAAREASKNIMVPGSLLLEGNVDEVVAALVRVIRQ